MIGTKLVPNLTDLQHEQVAARMRQLQQRQSASGAGWVRSAGVHSVVSASHAGRPSFRCSAVGHTLTQWSGLLCCCWCVCLSAGVV